MRRLASSARSKIFIAWQNKNWPVVGVVSHVALVLSDGDCGAGRPDERNLLVCGDLVKMAISSPSIFHALAGTSSGPGALPPPYGKYVVRVLGRLGAKRDVTDNAEEIASNYPGKRSHPD